MALAAQAAGTNDATVFAPYINGLTTGGETCTDYASCAEILAAGGDVDYDGASGPLDFADPGEPAVASFGLLQFGEDNKIDDSKTEFQVAGRREQGRRATPVRLRSRPPPPVARSSSARCCR